MSVSGAGLVVPLLGNPAITTSTSSSGVARVVPGVSDRPAESLGTSRRALSLSLIDPHGPFASRLRSAISGVFDRTERVRDAALALGTVTDEALRFGTPLDTEAVVEKTKALVTAVNDLRQFIRDNPDTLAAGLLDRVDGATSSYGLRADLFNVGVTIEPDGMLTLRESVLRENLAAQPEFTGRTLGYSAGLAKTELGTATGILNGATVSIVGFSNLPGPSYLLSETHATHLDLAGRFVDLFV